MRWSAVCLLLVSAPASAQSKHSGLPFQVGEKAQYRVSYGLIGRVGSGSLEVLSQDTVRGRPTYRLVFALRGGIPGARINDRLESWFDPVGLYSRRYTEKKDEVSFDRDRAREFLVEERRWVGHTNQRQESGVLPTDRPLDDVSFIFFIRTMTLEVGREYTLDRYWDPDGNPVRLRVLRHETVRVPGGSYRTVVVKPIIKTSGLFKEGGSAEMYFSEGPHRELVQLRVKLSIGTLRIQLEKYVAGGANGDNPIRN